MLPIQINLRNKSVLLIGGGEVARRKAVLFLKEGAIVSILAPCINEDIQSLHIEKIDKSYEKSDLKGYFLVYAATNDLELNELIIKDCNEMNILCGSATYNEDVSFYSMGFEQTKTATIALSMNQKLPYHKPLLKQMVQLLDENQERIELLADLRVHVIQVENKRHYFDLLYACPLELLKFMKQALDAHVGYLFVYHQSRTDENFRFTLKPHYVITLKELKQYYELFLPFYEFFVVPLTLTNGYIYTTIHSLLPNHQCSLSLISCDEDVKKIIQYYRSSKTTYYFIHPQSNQDLVNMFEKHLQEHEKIVDFHEEILIHKNESYRFVVLLMTSGQHYKDLLKKTEDYIRDGYDIEYTSYLLEDARIVEMIEEK